MNEDVVAGLLGVAAMIVIPLYVGERPLGLMFSGGFAGRTCLRTMSGRLGGRCWGARRR